MGLEDSFHEGLKAYRDGRYQEAIQLLYDAVAENERNHKAWNALGVTFSKLGRFEEALNCYENALKYDPGNLSYEQNRDQIVKKAFSRIATPEPVPRTDVSVNYRKFIIPGILLGFIVLLAIYVLVISTSLGGSAGDVHKTAVVPTKTPIPDSISPNLTTPAVAQQNQTSSSSIKTSPTTSTDIGNSKEKPSLLIDGNLVGKYLKGLSEISFSIVLTDGSNPQYLPRVSYLWSAGSLDPITVLPANPASGTIKPGDKQLVTLQIPQEQQPRSGEKFTLEIRPPTGEPAIYSSELPDDYRGGDIANPSPQYNSFLVTAGSARSGNNSSSPSGDNSNLAVEGSLNGYYGSDLEQVTLTLRAPAAGSPQDMTGITYFWSTGSSSPVQITQIQPPSGTINPGEQQLVTLTIPESARTQAGESFTLEIKPSNGQSLLVRKALSSAYQGGVIS